ncbi:MAG: hypothetical protein K0Q57_460, partial [Gammaproteobacteria bacterium]|nr:hypothetical protein [Gammaproteobacteria bacterium]
MLGSSSPRAEINYQEIFESVPGQYLILMPNADYTILAVSNNYLRVTNTTREQIVGKSLLQVFPPNPEDPDISKSLGIIRESLLRVLHSKTEDNMPVIKYDIRKVLGEGGRFEERYWSSINTPVLNPDGTIKYIIHRTEDVTELALLKEKSVSEKHRSSDEMQRMAIEIFNKAEEIKRAQEKLRAASEERALLEQSLEEKRKIIELSEKFRKQQVDFIDTLCHEIRNPLSAVMLSVDLQVETLTELNSLMNSSSVAAELHKSEIAIKLKKAHEFAAAISLGVKHQKLIVDNVLDLSRLISGKFELNPVPVNISIVFDSMIEIFRPQIQARGLEFCSAIPGEPLWVKADATRLMQVISNILSNALKFTAKGHIAFNVKYEPIADQKIELQVSVNDTGIGISEEQKLRIFQPYEKASRRTAIEHGSSGLGLSITQKLIEKMGGHIHISSKEGEGSKFEFTANLERLNPEE